MFAVALASIIQTSIQAPTIKLIYEVDQFRIVDTKGAETTVKVDAPAYPIRTSYRKDETNVYWDALGITVTNGDWSYTTNLEEAALSPKLFTREEILKTKELVSQRKRELAANALSGSLRIGNNVYMLVRWDDSSGKPWLEAVYSVSLSEKRAKPVLLAKSPGFSLAKGEADDVLFATPGGFGTYVRTPEGDWGTALYDLDKKTFTFTKMGTNLVAYDRQTAGRWIAELTPYKKTRISWMANNGSRRVIHEVKTVVEFVRGAKPMVAVVGTNLGTGLLNLDSGIFVNLPADGVVRLTPHGFLVWPDKNPEKAYLLSSPTFTKVATAVTAI